VSHENGKPKGGEVPKKGVLKRSEALLKSEYKIGCLRGAKPLFRNLIPPSPFKGERGIGLYKIGVREKNNFY